jgi:aminoglycoside 6'-N-acetyltransferase
MKLDLSTYSFRPAAIDDLPRLRRWLHAPEVRRWWGNPSEQFELLRADLDEPRMTMRLVSLNGRPFAYAQDYEVHAWPQPHLAHLPQGSRAIDSFIGWPSMIGRGHGQAYLRLLAERLCIEGAPFAAIDPAIDNVRAACLRKGGLSPRRAGRDRRGPSGPDALRARASAHQFGFAPSALSAPTMPDGAK